MKTHENVGVVSSYLSGYSVVALLTQMLAPASSEWVCWLCWCRITRLNTSEFLYYLDELYGNKLVFSFVSSNSTNSETAEQFILLYTRYVCDFSGLTNFPQKLWNSKKTFTCLYRILFSSSVFLLLTHDEFFDAFQRKKFRLETVCLFQRCVNYRIAYPEKLFPWPPVCLLASEKVVSFFICEEC